MEENCWCGAKGEASKDARNQLMNVLEAMGLKAEDIEKADSKTIVQALMESLDEDLLVEE